MTYLSLCCMDWLLYWYTSFACDWFWCWYTSIACDWFWYTSFACDWFWCWYTSFACDSDSDADTLPLLVTDSDTGTLPLLVTLILILAHFLCLWLILILVLFLCLQFTSSSPAAFRQRWVSATYLILLRSKHIKGSKEHYLSGQNTTCKFSGWSTLSISHKMTLEQQLKSEKEKKNDEKWEGQLIQLSFVG